MCIMRVISLGKTFTHIAQVNSVFNQTRVEKGYQLLAQLNPVALYRPDAAI